MPILAVYTADPSALSDITNALFSTQAPTPLGRWTASHRVHRALPHSLENSGQQSSTSTAEPQRYHQLLTLGHRPGWAWACVGAAGQTGQQPKSAVNDVAEPDATKSSSSIVAIPVRDLDNLYQLLSTRVGALWMPLQRQTLHITGTTYELGDYTVRLGEARGINGPSNTLGAVPQRPTAPNTSFTSATAGSGASTPSAPAGRGEQPSDTTNATSPAVGLRTVVVSIEGEGEGHGAEAKAMIRGVARLLGLTAGKSAGSRGRGEPVREYIGHWGEGEEDTDDGIGSFEARLWCEALRARL